MGMYAVFGGHLRSALTFADLTQGSDGAPDWNLEVLSPPVPLRPDLQQLGSDEVTPEVTVRLYRHDAGMRLVFDDTGTFDVLDEGRTIRWYQDAQADLDAARLDVLGRVLPLALHMGSCCTLHGSAVRLADGAVAFLAPKHHGKSTLACALAAAGGELLSDDVVPVQLGRPVTTLPGIRRIRLWSDAATRLGAVGGMTSAAPGDKHLLEPPGRGRWSSAPARLAGIYLLAPVPVSDDVAAARRTKLSEFDATLALLTQMKLGSLLGGSEGASVLEFCAQLARSVPVYRLHVVRGFERLDAVVAAITGWHGVAADPASTASA